jgi:ketosteroid isomerase-like protein
VIVAGQRSRLLIETLRPLYEEGNRAWNEGDIQRAYSTLPEDFEMRLSANWPNARGALHGPDEIVAFFEDFREMFPDARTGSLDFIEVDDRRAIVGFPVTGTGRGSGARTEMEIWQLWEVSEDFVPVRLTEYSTRQQALEAAGLPMRAGEGAE